MKVDGVEADYEECAVAVDGSVIWRAGVRYVPAPKQEVEWCEHHGYAHEYRGPWIGGNQP